MSKQLLVGSTTLKGSLLSARHKDALSVNEQAGPRMTKGGTKQADRKRSES